MKYMKLIVPLAAVVLLLMVAMPAAADDPFGGPPSKTSGNGANTWAAIYIGGTWDNVRGVAQYYHNPDSGCFPGGGQVPGGAKTMTWQPIPQTLGLAQNPQPGIATQLNQVGQPKAVTQPGNVLGAAAPTNPAAGVNPGVGIVGIANQNGEEFRVGGVIASPCVAGLDALTGVVSSVEWDRYVTNWSPKTPIPAGSTRWFKFDTVKSRDVEVYLDDVPKWGAAYRYFDVGRCVNNGTGNCNNADNLERLGIDTSEIGKWWTATQALGQGGSFGEPNSIAGYYARVFPPENIMRPDYFWPTPNNSLLTTSQGTRPRVADTQGALGGYIRAGASRLTTSDYPGTNYTFLSPADQVKMGDGNTHLLGAKFHWDGWVYVRVYNNMIWDGDVIMGTRYTPFAGYDFPCDNCPFPLNPYGPPKP